MSGEIRWTKQTKMAVEGICPKCKTDGGICANCLVCHGCDYVLSPNQANAVDAARQWWEENPDYDPEFEKELPA